MLPAQATLTVFEREVSEFGDGYVHAGQAPEHVAPLCKGAAQGGAANTPVACGRRASGHDVQGFQKRCLAGLSDVGVPHGDPAKAGQDLPHPIAVSIRSLLAAEAREDR